MDYNKIAKLVYSTKEIVFDKKLNANISMKGAADYVTAVDLHISDFLKSNLYDLYPSIGFITEEENNHNLTEKCFILDPIDGTTNLIHDYKMSSVSLAYCEYGEPVFGIIYNPFSKEMFFGFKGKGSYLYNARNGINSLLKIGIQNYKKNRLKCSNLALKDSIIEFGAGSTHKENATDNFGLAKRVFCNCIDLRRVCSTAISLCYIASGRIDGYFEKVIKPWDFAAGILIISEAGGKATDWKNETLPLDKSTTIIATNMIIHNDLIALISGEKS